MTPGHLALWRIGPYHNFQVQLGWRGHLTTSNATCGLRKFCDKRTMRNNKALYHRSAVAMALCSHMPGCLSVCPSDAVRTGYPGSFSPDVSVSRATPPSKLAAEDLAAPQSSTTTFQVSELQEAVKQPRKRRTTKQSSVS